MARRRKTNNPGRKLPARKVHFPMPDLFPRTVREWRRRKSAHFPDNYLSQEEEEQLTAFVGTAWESADTDTQEYFCHLANGLPAKQSQSSKSKPNPHGARPPPRTSAGARRKKAPNRSRAKRTTVTPPPPDAEVRAAAPPSHDSLDLPSPPTPCSTCSSVSIPLRAIVQSGGSSLPEAGGAPQDQRADAALPVHTPSLSTDDFQPDYSLPPDPLPSFPFAHLYSLPAPPPLDPSLPPSAGVHPGTGLGLIPESTDGGGPPVERVDPTLLDVQGRVRDQMRGFYQSMPRSLGYAHMPDATEHWPRRW